MPVVVKRVVVVVVEVPAVDVVHVAVTVVVDASCTVALQHVDPHVVDQIIVHVIHAAVDHAHHDATVAGRDVPGLRGVDVGVYRASRLAVVVQTPQLTKIRIVRSRIGILDVIRLGIGDARATRQTGNHLLHVGAGGQLPVRGQAGSAVRGGRQVHQNPRAVEPIGSNHVLGRFQSSLCALGPIGRGHFSFKADQNLPEDKIRCGHVR